MFYTDNKLQYPVRVETPDPLFARALQKTVVPIKVNEDSSEPLGHSAILLPGH